MSNPNAFCAAFSSALAIGVQWLVQRYAHVELSDYWKAVVTSGATVVSLYVGKHGVKAALLRIWSGPRKLWVGFQPPAST